MAFLDDRLWVHPKWRLLDAEAFRVGIYGLCYAHGFVTRGYLTPVDFLTLDADDDLVAQLVDCGIWDPLDDSGGVTVRDGHAVRHALDNGVRIHDWEQYNDDERAAHKRKLSADRQRRKRDRDATGHAPVTHSHAGNNAGVTSQVTRDIERDVTRDLARARDESESESERSTYPLTPAKRGTRVSKQNPRALGSNPRAADERHHEQTREQRQTRKHELAAEAVHQWARQQGTGTDELHTTLDLIETDLHTTFSDQERITLIDQATTERQQLEAPS
jgi:hypothetical protein